MGNFFPFLLLNSSNHDVKIVKRRQQYVRSSFEILEHKICLYNQSNNLFKKTKTKQEIVSFSHNHVRKLSEPTQGVDPDFGNSCVSALLFSLLRHAVACFPSQAFPDHHVCLILVQPQAKVLEIRNLIKTLTLVGAKWDVAWSVTD